MNLKAANGSGTSTTSASAATPMFRLLPLRFDVERLRAEASQFTERDWLTHAAEPAGNASICLVSVGGTPNLDFAIAGPMEPTSQLERCPYLQQALRSLGVSLSRCRLLRLPGETGAPVEPDYSYHGFRRRSVLLPIVASGSVRFRCGDQSTHFSEGRAWMFDRTRPHALVNESTDPCVHLLIETKGSPVMDGLSGAVKTSAGAWREIYFQAGPAEPIPVEAYSFEVLAPSEVDSLVAEILRDAKIASTKDRRALAQRLDAWVCAWKMQFERYGHRRNGELAYRELILNLEEEMVPELESDLPPSGDGRHALEILRSVLSTGPVARTHGPVARNWSVKVRHRRGSRNDAEPFGCPVFRKPLVIVSAPRSGSTLLFETLVQCPNLWTIGTESHAVIEDIPALHPAAKDFHSNRLTADDATPTVVESLREGFARRLQDRTGRPYVELPAGQRPNSVRFLEKTPKNALRIPFLKAVFPDAQFIYLYREPRETISSMVEAWRARSFVSYRRLPGWPYRDWCFLLVPGWRSLKDCSLLEIATYQWQTAHEHILADLHDLPRSAWHCVDYAELVREPKRIIREIAEFGEFEWDQRLEQMVSGSLPLSSRTLSAPASDKWRKYASEFAGLLPGLQPDP